MEWGQREAWRLSRLPSPNCLECSRESCTPSLSLLWKEMGSISLSSTPSPQPPAWYGQLSPRCGPGGEGEVGGQVEGTDEKGRCRAVANTKCHFLFVTLRYESSRGWVEVLR